MDLSALISFVQPSLQSVRTVMAQALQTDIPLLQAANRSMLDSGGKLLRPTLALLVGGAIGAVNEDVVRFAAAAELLHNASLLHDDVVDEAAERRGRPTVAARIGNKASLLVGDFWLVKCVKVILESPSYSEPVIRLFSKTLSDLAEGEMLQLQCAGDASTTPADYARIIYAKTASLFETAARSAALAVQAAPGPMEAVAAYARQLGMAFQVRDDMLDYGASAVGKPVGVDLKEQKITQPLLCALQACPAQEAGIRAKVARIHAEPALLEEVRAFVLAQDGVARSAEVLQRYTRAAVEALASLPPSQEKTYLVQLACFVGERTY